MVNFQQSSVTRLLNDKTDAQRATMPMNQAAQMSLRNQYHGKKNKGPAASPMPPSPNKLVPTGRSNTPPPVGGTMSQPVEQEQAPSPLDAIVETLKHEKFMNSPRVKNALTNIQFQEMMNRGNPAHTPGSKTLFDRVVERIGYHESE